MEKWIAVIGSPRKGENTELLVDYIIQGLGERNITVDKIEYYDTKNMPVRANDSIQQDISKRIRMYTKL